MKRKRPGFRRPKREQLRQDAVLDSYRPRRKLSGPARCPGCAAVYKRGRWSWGLAPASAPSVRCPACQRIRDRQPAGYVRLEGRFFAAHADEVLARVRRAEQLEKEEHPLQRIMAIEREGAGMVVTTTDSHLARRIGEALRKSFKGESEFRYGRQENLLRVRWSR